MAYIPVRNYSADGAYPATEDQARHLFRNCDANGLRPAFVKVGGRVLFDPSMVQALLAERARANPPA